MLDIEGFSVRGNLKDPKRDFKLSGKDNEEDEDSNDLMDYYETLLLSC